MSQAAPAITRSPAEVVRLTPVSQAGNGICYAVAGETAVTSIDLERMIAAVPAKVARALERATAFLRGRLAEEVDLKRVPDKDLLWFHHVPWRGNVDRRPL